MTEKRNEERTDLRELITTIERMAMMIKDEYILDGVSYLRRISEKCGCSIQKQGYPYALLRFIVLII